MVDGTDHFNFTGDMSCVLANNDKQSAVGKSTNVVANEPKSSMDLSHFEQPISEGTNTV